jgi:multicomponent Na+:H+ antiporter subunit F
VIVVVVVAAVLLTAAAVLTLVRAERGPTMLDRTVALDVLTSIVLGAVALHAAWTRRTDSVPLLLALALVGFVSSVTIARFAAVEPEGEGRVLTREEVAELEAQRRADEEASDVDDESHGGPAPGEVAG